MARGPRAAHGPRNVIPHHPGDHDGDQVWRRLPLCPKRAALRASQGYFRVMGIPLVSGRALSEQDNSTAPGVAIISKSVARTLWPDGDALGRRITLEDRSRPEDWLTIIGVVVDVRQGTSGNLSTLCTGEAAHFFSAT